jgi:hypothetical protein
MVLSGRVERVPGLDGPHSVHVSPAGTQFTCFTSAKLQILTLRAQTAGVAALVC